jgi:hypothetical protein
MTISIDASVNTRATNHTGRLAIKLLAIFVWAGLIISFSLRVVPTSLDDNNYLNYFNGTEVEYSAADSMLGRLYTYAANEPLWEAYSYSIDRIFSPENCVRITIAISLLLLAIAAFLSGRPLLFLAMYATTPELLFNINYTQIREGFALAVFLTVLRLSRSIKLSALLACLIHSSFILLLMAAFVREVKTRTQAAVAISISIIGSFLLWSQLGASGLLGRRNYYQDLIDTNNPNFWVVSISISIAVFLLARRYSRMGNVGQIRAEILDISVLNTIGALLFSIFVAPIAGRFIIISDVLQIYALSDRKTLRSQPVWAFIFVWLLFQTYELYGNVQHGLDFFVSFKSLF